MLPRGPAGGVRWPVPEAVLLALLPLPWVGPDRFVQLYNRLPEAALLSLPFFVAALAGLSAGRLTGRALRAASASRAALSGLCSAAAAAAFCFWGLIVRGLGDTSFLFVLRIAVLAAVPAALILFGAELWKSARRALSRRRS